METWANSSCESLSRALAFGSSLSLTSATFGAVLAVFAFSAFALALAWPSYQSHVMGWNRKGLQSRGGDGCCIVQNTGKNGSQSAFALASPSFATRLLCGLCFSMAQCTVRNTPR